MKVNAVPQKKQRAHFLYYYGENLCSTWGSHHNTVASGWQHTWGTSVGRDAEGCWIIHCFSPVTLKSAH